MGLSLFPSGDHRRWPAGQQARSLDLVLVGISDEVRDSGAEPRTAGHLISLFLRALHIHRRPVTFIYLCSSVPYRRASFLTGLEYHLDIRPCEGG
jgi:hypothetical protein